MPLETTTKSFSFAFQKNIQHVSWVGRFSPAFFTLLFPLHDDVVLKRVFSIITKRSFKKMKWKNFKRFWLLNRTFTSHSNSFYKRLSHSLHVVLRLEAMLINGSAFRIFYSAHCNVETQTNLIKTFHSSSSQEMRGNLLILDYYLLIYYY